MSNRETEQLIKPFRENQTKITKTIYLPLDLHNKIEEERRIRGKGGNVSANKIIIERLTESYD